MFDLPCKKCLVQATCKERCDEFNEYSFLPIRIKAVGAGLSTGSLFAAVKATISQDLTWMIVFFIAAVLGSIFITIGVTKERKYYTLAEEFMMYESRLYKKFGIKMPMGRRSR